MITQDLKAIIKALDKAAALAKKNAYTQDLVERIEALAEIAQEKLEEA